MDDETPVERWLRAHQSPDGRWEAEGFGRWQSGREVDDPVEGAGRSRNDVAVTALALLAHLRAGYDERSPHPSGVAIRWGIRWLESVQTTEGGFRPEGMESALGNALGTWALATAARAPEGRGAGVLPAAQRAIDLAVAAVASGDPEWRRADGPGGVPALAWLVPAFHGDYVREPSANDPIRIPESVRSALYREVAGWSRTSDEPGRHAAAILARCFSGEDPRRSEDIASSVKTCMAHPPQWETGDSPSPHMDFGTWYLGTLALYRVGGESWIKWNAAMKPATVDTQRKDTTYGRYRGSWNPVDRWGPEGGRVYATATSLLCLEVYYSYDRVFGSAGP